MVDALPPITARIGHHPVAGTQTFLFRQLLNGSHQLSHQSLVLGLKPR